MQDDELEGFKSRIDPRAYWAPQLRRHRDYQLSEILPLYCADPTSQAPLNRML